MNGRTFATATVVEVDGDAGQEGRATGDRLDRLDQRADVLALRVGREADPTALEQALEASVELILFGILEVSLDLVDDTRVHVAVQMGAEDGRDVASLHQQCFARIERQHRGHHGRALVVVASFSTLAVNVGEEAVEESLGSCEIEHGSPWKTVYERAGPGWADNETNKN